VRYPRVAFLCLLALQYAGATADAQRPILVQFEPPRLDSAMADRTLPNPIRVMLLQTKGSPIDAAPCEKLSVQFTPLGGGSAVPASAPAVWTGGRCMAQAWWHLSADTGRQLLEARAVDPSTATPALRSNPVLDTVRAYGPAQRPIRLQVEPPSPESGMPDKTLPAPIRVKLVRTTTNTIDSAACESFSVQFTALTGGSVAPGTAPAFWDGAKCLAVARWHLSADTGQQYLDARVVDPSTATPTIRSNAVSVPAHAVAPARDLFVRWAGTSSFTDYAGRAFGPIVGNVLHARDSTAPDSAECNSLSVQFTPYGGGTTGAATPSVAPAAWKRGGGVVRDSCFVRTVWRLADDPGDQYLQATVQQGNTQSPVIRSNASDSSLHAMARLQPEFVVGWVGVPDAKDKSGLVRSAAGRLFAGLEFPLMFPSRHVWPQGGFLSRLRLLLGISTANPGREWYVGVCIHPMVMGTRYERFPIRLATGWAIQDARPFLAVQISTIDLLTPLKPGFTGSAL